MSNVNVTYFVKQHYSCWNGSKICAHHYDNDGRRQYTLCTFIVRYEIEIL